MTTVERVPAQRLTGVLLPDIRDVFAEAYGGSDYRLEDFPGFLARWTSQPDFRAVVARGATGRVDGLAYGYRLEPGERMHDLVAPQLTTALRERWLTGAFGLAQLAVRPAAEGAGLGGRLHDALQDGLRQRSAVLAVAEGNQRARRLYEARGWQILLAGFRYPLPQVPQPYAILGLDLSGGPVRLLGAADALRRAGELTRVYRAAFAGPPWHEGEGEAQRFADRLPDHVRRPGFRIAVATRDGGLAGFAYGYQVSLGAEHQVLHDRVAQLTGVEFFEGSWALIELAVDPGAWRLGLGGRLHDAVLGAAPAARAWVLTRADATAAQAPVRRPGMDAAGADPRPALERRTGGPRESERTSRSRAALRSS